ncbi:MAG: sigma-70 family RNA polymerase sigma factor [Deltaproteobacteria bacterium]|nr:sigma-70 family RNA polymerase sigma factor [Deltaproteobacteria bacterium]
MAADDVASLLAHADWLRDLARKLVGGADADDAVQETYVAALRSPPDPDLPAKPWLARVLRNASRMSHRSAARRTRREDAVTQIATPPSSADETVARAETFRMLVELVMALDDPYRTTLLRHYFDGETFAAIARRDGVPEATVRGRHKHALDQLRRRLDARSQGDRRAWLASLAPLAAPPAHTTSVTIGAVLMKKILVAAIVAVAFAGAIWHWVPRTAAVARPGAASSSTAAPSTVAPAAVPTASPAPPPQHVRKLASTDERRELAAQIAAAQAARKAGHAPVRPSPGAGEPTGGGAGSDHEGDMDKEVIRSAMHEVLPFLADCYGAARAKATIGDHLEIRAHFTLTGDPDVGTLIDAKQLFDEKQRALPSTLDDCIRGTLQTLELPPLGDGETVEVDYPLVFADGSDDGSGQ